jgi:hypothetical protein
MADSVKKGARVTGSDRSKLAGERTKKHASDSTSNDEVPDESGPVPESKAPQE